MEQGRVSVVPRRLIRRTALVACTGPFSSLGENPEDFAKDVGRNWSSGPAVNLIVRLPDVGLPVLSNLKLNSDVSCTHGNYWTIFAGIFPDRPDSFRAAVSDSGVCARIWFWSAASLFARTG
jgi:hypothetical protein